MYKEMTAIVPVFCTLVALVHGNGRLLVPPQRSSLWRDPAFYRNRFVFKNYDDHTLNCGGFWKMHENDGKCGVCGDPFDAEEPRPNEAGGMYGRGIIGRTYSTDKRFIDAVVQITSSMSGYFEFNICPNNDVKQRVTQECLDEFPLRILSKDRTTSYGRRYIPEIKPGTGGIVELSLEIPEGMECTQCVLQWRWHGANNYGICRNGQWAKGCGNQPEIYNCADIAILPDVKNGKSEEPIDPNDQFDQQWRPRPATKKESEPTPKPKATTAAAQRTTASPAQELTTSSPDIATKASQIITTFEPAKTSSQGQLLVTEELQDLSTGSVTQPTESQNVTDLSVDTSSKSSGTSRSIDIPGDLTTVKSIRTTKQPVGQTTDGSAILTTQQQAGQTTDGSAILTTEQQAEQTTDGTAILTTEQPAEQTTDSTAILTTEQPVKQTTDGAAILTTKKPAEQTTDDTAILTTEQPVEQSTDGKAILTTEQPVEQSTDGTAILTTKQPAEHTTDGTAVLTTKQPAEQTTDGTAVLTTKQSVEQTTDGTAVVTTKQPVEQSSDGTAVLTTKQPVEQTTDGTAVLTTEQSVDQPTDSNLVLTTVVQAEETTVQPHEMSTEVGLVTTGPENTDNSSETLSVTNQPSVENYTNESSGTNTPTADLIHSDNSSSSNAGNNAATGAVSEPNTEVTTSGLTSSTADRQQPAKISTPVEHVSEEQTTTGSAPVDNTVNNAPAMAETTENSVWQTSSNSTLSTIDDSTNLVEELTTGVSTASPLVTGSMIPSDATTVSKEQSISNLLDDIVALGKLNSSEILEMINGTVNDNSSTINFGDVLSVISGSPPGEPNNGTQTDTTNDTDTAINQPESTVESTTKGVTSTSSMFSSKFEVTRTTRLAGPTGGRFGSGINVATLFPTDNVVNIDLNIPGGDANKEKERLATINMP